MSSVSPVAAVGAVGPEDPPPAGDDERPRVVGVVEEPLVMDGEVVGLAGWFSGGRQWDRLKLLVQGHAYTFQIAGFHDRDDVGAQHGRVRGFVAESVRRRARMTYLCGLPPLTKVDAVLGQSKDPGRTAPLAVDVNWSAFRAATETTASSSANIWFCILSRSRSGSTMLSSALMRHKDILMHGEVFGLDEDHPNFYGLIDVVPGEPEPPLYNTLRWYRATHPRSFLYDFVFQPSVRAAIGFKIKFEELFTEERHDIRAMLEAEVALKIIYLRRKNLYARLRSERAALARGTFNTTDPGYRAEALAEFAPITAEDLIAEAAADQRCQEYVRALSGHQILEVEYDDLCGRLQQEQGRVLDFIGVPQHTLIPRTARLPRPRERDTAAEAQLAADLISQGFTELAQMVGEGEIMERRWKDHVEQYIRENPANGDYLRFHSRRFVRSLEILEEALPRHAEAALEVGAIGLFAHALVSKMGVERCDVSIYDRNRAETELSFPFKLADKTLEFRGFNIDLESSPLPVEDESYDLIASFEVLEHMAVDPMYHLAELNRVMRTGGILVLSTPNITSARAVKSILDGWHPHFFCVYNRHRTRDRHNLEYSPQLLSAALDGAGFEIQRLWSEDLFNEPVPEVIEFLRDAGYPIDNRGDVLLCLAAKVGPVKERYPALLYG